jgi:adenosylcobinamide-phosphate synthase
MTVLWAQAEGLCHWELLAGVGLDLAFGDPRWMPHPIRGFGWVAARLDRALPRAKWAGAIYAVTLVSGASAAVWLTLPWANIYWIWALLALRDLDFEATLVLRRLDARDIEGARQMLARIVGRDTQSLDEPEILRAVIETVAENLSDAVIAPLFYLMLAGPVGMAAYKAINTLDSMVGYRNERYREFGWFAARLDDVANLIPARLSALLVWTCALLLGYDARNSVRVTLRDAARQPSPNSGYPEAAVAGALGVRLGGLNYYGGTASRKAYLGEPLRPLCRVAFLGARRLLYGSAMLMVALACGVLR